MDFLSWFDWITPTNPFASLFFGTLFTIILGITVWLDNSSTIIEVNEEGFKETDDELISQLIDNKEGWVYMLTCLKGYLEFGVNKLRAGFVK